MKNVYICKFAQIKDIYQSHNYDWVSMIFTNEKAAKEWLTHAKKQCDEWKKTDHHEYVAWYYKEQAWTKCPF